MKRSGQLRRRSPMARGGRVKPVNRERAAAKRRQNFGDESEHVREMTCSVHRELAIRGGWGADEWMIDEPLPDGWTGCSSTPSVPAHVTARGMGAAKGGRFDIVPLCAAHHEDAGEARTSKRAAFEQRYGLDLRRLADDIALGMPEPLGIRGLARRFAAWLGCEWPGTPGVTAKIWTDSDAGPVAFSDGQWHLRLDPYEADALFGWVDRRAERVWSEQPEAIGESAVLAVLVTELGLTIDAAGDLLDAATEGRP